MRGYEEKGESFVLRKHISCKSSRVTMLSECEKKRVKQLDKSVLCASSAGMAQGSLQNMRVRSKVRLTLKYYIFC